MVQGSARPPARRRPIDVLLLATDWRTRAPLRAQLIEESFEVVATDEWTDARQHLRRGAKPRLVVVDLQGLPEADAVLRDLKVLMKPERVLAITAIGTASIESVRRLGFTVVARPVGVGDLVASIRGLLARTV
jgi:DNA-binding response OmpR family regulator